MSSRNIHEKCQQAKAWFNLIQRINKAIEESLEQKKHFVSVYLDKQIPIDLAVSMINQCDYTTPIIEVSVEGQEVCYKIWLVAHPN
jgi:hypothetical protein